MAISITDPNPRCLKAWRIVSLFSSEFVVTQMYKNPYWASQRWLIRPLKDYFCVPSIQIDRRPLCRSQDRGLCFVPDFDRLIPRPLRSYRGWRTCFLLLD